MEKVNQKRPTWVELKKAKAEGKLRIALPDYFSNDAVPHDGGVIRDDDPSIMCRSLRDIRVYSDPDTYVI